MSAGKDYTKYSFFITGLVILALVSVSFIPGFRIGDTVVKRVNILSDLIPMQDDALAAVSCESLIDTTFLADIPDELLERISVLTPAEQKPAEIEYTKHAPKRTTRPVITDENIVQIEDFSADGDMMPRFYNSLAYETYRRPVRIAVLGDSFIEADIITADMREQLQLKYGGNGVGFVPFATPLSKYRGTVRHTYEGWETYNIIKKKTIPEEYKDWFFVSGMISVPSEGAVSRYEGVQFRKRIEQTNTARLLFVNRGKSSLEVTVNDSITTRHTPESRSTVDYIRIGHDNIRNLSVKVDDAEGFIGYGVVMEDRVGVSVHNFSVRSNSGTALFGTNPEINKGIDSLMSYDLIILQYGLNAMSADVTDYKYYEKQLCRIIEYIKVCFPESAIVVMSVGDRSTQKNGTATTMPAVDAMIMTQRNAARLCGVGFWNTFQAMGGKDSMPKFVERKWAAKDHTHIGYPGGKYIAGRFVEFLNAAVDSIHEIDGDALEERRIRDSLDTDLRSDNFSAERARRREEIFRLSELPDSVEVRLMQIIGTDPSEVEQPELPTQETAVSDEAVGKKSDTISGESIVEENLLPEMDSDEINKIEAGSREQDAAAEFRDTEANEQPTR